MPNKVYIVDLTDEERQTLEDITRKGQTKARKFKRAMVLLKADNGLSDAQIMEAVSVSRPMVARCATNARTTGSSLR